MKRGGGSQKGADFERTICKQLSQWWTNGERDDVFWRTAGSGGRATNRAKQGQKTAGAYGDLTYTDAIGETLLKLCCFELKRGYGKFDVLDLLEKRATPHKLEMFWTQACKSAEDAGAYYPFVIFKQDRKSTMIMGPRNFLLAIDKYTGPYLGQKLSFIIGNQPVFIISFAALLDFATPESIRGIYADFIQKYVCNLEQNSGHKLKQRKAKNHK